jgi:hypothetical protein
MIWITKRIESANTKRSSSPLVLFYQLIFREHRSSSPVSGPANYFELRICRLDRRTNCLGYHDLTVSTITTQPSLDLKLNRAIYYIRVCFQRVITWHDINPTNMVFHRQILIWWSACRFDATVERASLILAARPKLPLSRPPKHQHQ